MIHPKGVFLPWKYIYQKQYGVCSQEQEKEKTWIICKNTNNNARRGSFKFQPVFFLIERGIAEMVTFTIILVFRVESFCCFISCCLMDCAIKLAYRSPPCFMSSALYVPIIFTLIGNDCFWSCHANSVSKPSIKTVEKFVVRFRGYLGEIELDSQSAWTCICTLVPRSVFPILKSQFATRFDFKNICPLFWLAQRVCIAK